MPGTFIVAPHFIGQLWQLMKRTCTFSLTSVHSFSTSSVQKPFLLCRAFPQAKAETCHASLWTAISLESKAAENGRYALYWIFISELDIFQHIVTKLNKFIRPCNVDVPLFHEQLWPLTLCLPLQRQCRVGWHWTSLLDGSKTNPVFTGQTDSSHVRLWLIQLLLNNF